MVAYTMRLSIPAKIPPSRAKTTFYWTPTGRCSFTSTFGPRLGSLGPVPDANVEFVRLAGAVYAADRTTPRKGGGSNWNQRQLEVTVPVFSVQRWQAIADELAALLAFLTGDDWTLHFHRSVSPKEKVAQHEPGAERVVLLSGGADSAVGALLSRSKLEAGQHHTLVSHVGLTVLSPIQQSVASTIETLLPGPGQRHVAVSFRRRREQPDGTKLRNEPSSRSRSLLFLAFGLAVASLDNVPLWIPENGFASLNPPLGPERRGSLSTKTTHPAFLGGLTELLAKAGAHAEIHNPFASMTKGEMFSLAADLIGGDAASKLLSGTHSCGLTGQRAFGISPVNQCGVCFGCVVRRASFEVASIKDRTAYIHPGDDPKVVRWLASESVTRSIQDFVRRGIRPRDIAAMSLPPGYSAQDAMNLCQRAANELGALIT